MKNTMIAISYDEEGFSVSMEFDKNTPFQEAKRILDAVQEQTFDEYFYLDGVMLEFELMS